MNRITIFSVATILLSTVSGAAYSQEQIHRSSNIESIGRLVDQAGRITRTSNTNGDDLNNDLYSIQDGDNKNAVDTSIGGDNKNDSSFGNDNSSLGGGGSDNKNNDTGGSFDNENAFSGSGSNKENESTGSSSNNKEQEQNNSSQNNQNNGSAGDNKNNDSGDGQDPDNKNSDNSGEESDPENSNNNEASPNPDGGGEGGGNEVGSHDPKVPHRVIINPGSGANRLSAHGVSNPSPNIGVKKMFDHTAGDGSGAIDPNQLGKGGINGNNPPATGSINYNQFDNGKFKGKGLGNPNTAQGK